MSSVKCPQCGSELSGWCFTHGDFCNKCQYACPKCRPDLGYLKGLELTIALKKQMDYFNGLKK